MFREKTKAIKAPVKDKKNRFLFVILFLFFICFFEVLENQKIIPQKSLSGTTRGVVKI